MRPPAPVAGARRAAPAAGVLAAVLSLTAAACLPDTGQRPEDVLSRVEQAAAAWDAEDLDVLVDCYTGEHAGRFREELATVHGGDLDAFFASKRRMVVVGPVSIRRAAFATVRVIVLRKTGFKPYAQVAVVFRDGRWLIDSYLPGDVEEPRVDKANALGVIGLLRDAAEITRPAGSDGVFAEIQTIRAIEVVALRRIDGAAEALRILLASEPEAAIRQFSAHTLGLLGDVEAIPVLTAALADGDLRVRADAAGALAGLGAIGALPEIRRLAEGDPSAWVRARAAAAAAALAGE